MNMIIENWYIILAAVLILELAAIGVYTFVKLPKSERIAKVEKWLEYACIKAEKELGSGTGQIKLRMVYDMFLSRFPAIEKMVTFECFSAMVDNALIEVRKKLKENERLAQYVNSDAQKDNI